MTLNLALTDEGFEVRIPQLQDFRTLYSDSTANWRFTSSRVRLASYVLPSIIITNFTRFCLSWIRDRHSWVN